MPLKLLTLVTLIGEVAQLFPCWIVRLEKLVVSVKSGFEPVLKTAVCTVSGTAPRFAVTTHVVVPETLLSEHPV